MAGAQGWQAEGAPGRTGRGLIVNQAADDLPDDLPFGVAETCRELLKDWDEHPREAKCLRRLVADPEMCAIYRRLNKCFDADAGLIRLFVREIFLAAIKAETYYSDKPAREEFDRRRRRAIAAGREFAEQIAYLSELRHGGGLDLLIRRDAMEAAANSATQIANALADTSNIADFWSGQSSGTERRAVFVRALEKCLHRFDASGMAGLNGGGGARLLSYAEMATVTRVALGLPHTSENGTRFDAPHVREALKSYREMP